MPQGIHPWADLVSVALTLWMGIHTIRTGLAMAGWVLGTGLSGIQLGLLFLSIWGAGLLGRPAARLIGGRRPAFRMLLVFGTPYAICRFVPGTLVTPLLSGLALIAWLWLFPTTLRAVSLGCYRAVILPGMLLGAAGQVGLQTLLHGMDLTMLLGPEPGLIALLLVTALAVAFRLGSAGQSGPAGGPVDPGGAVPGLEGDAPGWGLAAWGPYLALQLTLLGNLGRVQQLSGWGLQSAAAVTLGSLALGGLLAGLRWPRWARGLAGLAAVLSLAQPRWLEGAGIWLLFGAQALLPVAAAPGFSPSPGRRAGNNDYLWTGVGSVVGITTMLLFYWRNEWKPLWPAMAALAVTPGLLAGEPAGRGAFGHSLRAAGAVAAVAALALPLSLLPRSTVQQPTGPAPANLTVMTYNVHHLFGGQGLPDPEAVARTIEAASPDLVGLQETSRGWNVIGGIDLVAWLRWRFPDYQVFYARSEGDLVGNILMSRYLVSASGWELYDMKAARLQRGYLWVRLPTVRGDLLCVNTHLSAWRSEEPDRVNQVDGLVAFWGGSPRFILMGDLNSRPGSEPLRRLEQAGLFDLPARLGMGSHPTFPSASPRIRLDYVFASPDLRPAGAEILSSGTSDHLPVVVRITVP